MMPRILAFDPGLNLGIAEYDETGSFVESTLVNFDSEIPYSRRLELITTQIRVQTLMRTNRLCYQPWIIAVESVNRVFGGAKNDNSDAPYRVYGYVHEQAYFLGIRVIDVPVMTAKAEFTGSGKAKKTDVQAQARLFTGKEKIDNNEADAVAIGYTVAKLLHNTDKPKGKESDFRLNIRTLADHFRERS